MAAEPLQPLLDRLAAEPHYHCPDGCEKSMEFRLSDGRLVCGRCYHRFCEVVEMVPCTPETCPGH